MNNKKIPITIAEGDGIGPEIMTAVLKILDAAKAPLEYRKVDIGEKVYLKGESSGIATSTWDTIRQTKAFLKAPITTPQGGGFKSLNVTIRTTLGLYANVRPCIAYNPYIATKHPGMDLVIVRENEEDLYTGIEYRQSPDTVHALKIITRPGCEKIIRYAFEYAQTYGRKKVTCFTKDNILKLSDGLFHKVFDEIASEYPHISNEHWIVDIGAAKLADTPEAFDIIVTPNLYGDILSDVAAQIAGSVGLAGSANIGQNGAVFEAIHGSAPRRAGQNMANPSGLLQGAILMLVHLEEAEIATLIQNAWLKTIEDGFHTYDIFKQGVSKVKVGTQEFAQEVIQRLGEKPESLKAVKYINGNQTKHKNASVISTQKATVGIDIFVDYQGSLQDLQSKLSQCETTLLKLRQISNRGTHVWPVFIPETFCTDQWRCRFTPKQKDQNITSQDIVDLLQNLTHKNIDFIHTEHLCSFDGKPCFSGSQ